MAATQQRDSCELVKIRCQRGSLIARNLGFSDKVAAGIRSLDEHWNGGDCCMTSGNWRFECDFGEPGKLDEDEFEVVRKHPYHTYKIFARMPRRITSNWMGKDIGKA